MLRQIDWGVQNRPITKNGVVPLVGREERGEERGGLKIRYLEYSNAIDKV